MARIESYKKRESVPRENPRWPEPEPNQRDVNISNRTPHRIKCLPLALAAHAGTGVAWRWPGVLEGQGFLRHVAMRNGGWHRHPVAWMGTQTGQRAPSPSSQTLNSWVGVQRGWIVHSLHGEHAGHRWGAEGGAEWRYCTSVRPDRLNRYPRC